MSSEWEQDLAKSSSSTASGANATQAEQPQEKDVLGTVEFRLRSRLECFRLGILSLSAADL